LRSQHVIARPWQAARKSLQTDCVGDIFGLPRSYTGFEARIPQKSHDGTSICMKSITVTRRPTSMLQTRHRFKTLSPTSGVINAS
jgi:hypothetical protein